MSPEFEGSPAFVRNVAQSGVVVALGHTSADSRQIYRETSIGTAVPSAEELAMVNHHFIQSISIKDSYNASTFEHQVLETLNQLFKTHDLVIMVGGSGLYIDAVCKGIDDLPTTDPEIRNRLLKRFETEGLEALSLELKSGSPDTTST